MSEPTGRVAVLGGGVMGQVVAAAVVEAGWQPGDVVVAEPFEQRRDELAAELGIEVRARAADAVGEVVADGAAGAVVVAVKPKDVGAVLDEVASVLDPGVLVVTVAAGLRAGFYEARLPAGTPVVRVMPNTPAVVGHGVSAIAPGRSAGEAELALTERLLGATGLVVRVEEPELDAVTAVSGSGPAYAFYLMEAMAEAGVRLGLDAGLARRLAVATVEGAGVLAARSGDDPGVLRERVSSPGGTTLAALGVLDERDVRGAVLAAAQACRDRAVEMAAESARPAGP